MPQPETTDLMARLRVWDICADPCRTMEARSGCLCATAADEIERLRALVTRLTDVAQDLAGGLTDPGTEALAAIHCGRHFIYG